MSDSSKKPPEEDAPTEIRTDETVVERTVDTTVYLPDETEVSPDETVVRQTVDPTVYRADDTDFSDSHTTVVRGGGLDATSVSTAGDAVGAADTVAPEFIIKERFVLESRLGKGGMGEVYKARDLRKEEAQDDDPYVAIKFLGEAFSRHPRALISLQREAKKSQQLAHPNVVTVYDFDRDGDRVYMTMEFLQGSALGGWRGIEFNLGAEPKEGKLIAEMASGLAYAHRFGVVHSDFKPDNVFVTTDGRVKILDFGIARIMEDALAQDSFDAGELGAMTLRYASLEMLQGDREPHPADDIYALGLMAYQLFADGQHPYQGRTAEQALNEGIQVAPLKGIPRHQWRAIRNAIALKREDRTPSAEAFLKEFSGTVSRNRIMLSAVAVLALTTAVFAYLASQRSDGPAIPFDELPIAQQQAISNNLEKGRQSAAIQDWDGASRYFMAAYELHPRNPDAEEGLDLLVTSLVEADAAMSSQRQKAYLKKLVDGYAGNEYLATHPDFIALRNALAQAVETAD